MCSEQSTNGLHEVQRGTVQTMSTTNKSMMADFTKSSEIGAQLFCRLGFKQSIDDLDNILFHDLPDTMQAEDVIEVYGKEGSGKTQILLHLVANCILPKAWKGLRLNGKEVGVVFIDTDYHFSLLRLTEILEHRISFLSTQESYQAGKPDISKDTQILIKTCLSRLILVRCNSSLQLLAAIESLDNVFANRPEICVLMIDSVGAFSWLDKSNAGDSTYDQEKHQRTLVALLKKFTRLYSLVVLATKPGIFHKDAGGQLRQKEHYEYMGRHWQNLVKYRYLVTFSVNSMFRFKRIYPFGKTTLQFCIDKTGLIFSDGVK